MLVGMFRKHYEQKIPLPDEALLLTKDKITLTSKLGEGAFGEVWQGTLRKSATQTIPAAIKVTKLKEDNKKYMQELFKEDRLLRQNVVGFFGMVMENENVMIVMEMVNGGGLDHYLKKKHHKCSYAFDVALGLYYLHSKRCMHRYVSFASSWRDFSSSIDTSASLSKLFITFLISLLETYTIILTNVLVTQGKVISVAFAEYTDHLE
ncbi:hypothetical protein OSTOST_25335, partial [Ostertagia ostertagi]